MNIRLWFSFIIQLSGNPPVPSRPIFFAQNFLQNLSRSTFGQTVQEFNGLGNFETTQMLPTVIEEISLAGLLARLESDDRFGDLAPLIIRDGDHRTFKDGGVTVEDTFDFR